MKIISNPSSNPVAADERNKKVLEPGFGKYYTDNMVIAQWNEDDWLVRCKVTSIWSINS